MNEFPAYRPTSSADPAGTGDGLWYVLVECPGETHSTPTVTARFGVNEAFGDLESALTAAKRCALDYTPPESAADNGRQVFRTGDREFMSIIDCVWSSYHFVTRVAQHVGDVVRPR